MIKNALLVFIGGGFGSVLRFLISKALNKQAFPIPYGTLTVNILGSLILGFILGMALKNDSLNNASNFLLSVGFCGGFTTFSTFAFENQALFRSGDYVHFAIYAFGSLILGLLAVTLGVFLTKFT
ncbi:fluoride efflux transporter CrcB [Salegentibacter chungangensis]|uniref:Fluoride-specific ion channel FluC n=1 Tax=Salegentibacter chungangensis TaxID=1335724 RepID=A0ABW3NQT6_9FLAO